MICSIEGHRERGDRLNNAKQGQEKIRWGQDDSGKRRKGRQERGRGRGRVSHREFDGRYFHISHYSLGWELREGRGLGQGRWSGRGERTIKLQVIWCAPLLACDLLVSSVCAWQREKEGERESQCESTCAWCVEGQEFREPDESKGRWTQTNCVCVCHCMCNRVTARVSQPWEIVRWGASNMSARDTEPSLIP